MELISIINFIVIALTLSFVVIMVGGSLARWVTKTRRYIFPDKKIFFDNTPEKMLVEFDKISRMLYSNLFIETDLNPNFYNRPDAIDYFMKLWRKGVKIKIIYDPRVKSLNEQLPLLYPLVKARIIDMKKSKKELTRHFLVADGEHVRMEKPHSFWENGEGVFLLNKRDLAKELERKFLFDWSND